MAPAIRSFAMRRNPSRSASAGMPAPSASSAARAGCGSIGIWNLPGSRRPSSTLQSVRVSGPPAP